MASLLAPEKQTNVLELLWTVLWLQLESGYTEPNITPSGNLTENGNLNHIATREYILPTLIGNMFFPIAFMREIDCYTQSAS